MHSKHCIFIAHNKCAQFSTSYNNLGITSLNISFKKLPKGFTTDSPLYWLQRFPNLKK